MRMYDVIIPARNEERTVANVILAAKQAQGVGKVIVVDDHSDDRTAQVAREAGAHVILSDGRRDKAMALATGVAASKAPVVVFFDADIGRVQPVHFESLAMPVMLGEYAMCCGLVDYKRMKSAVFMRLPPITGMRAVRRNIFLRIPRRKLKGYNIEILINRATLKERRAIRVLSGTTHRTKFAKRGWLRGLLDQLGMAWHLMGLYGLDLLHYVAFLRRLDIMPPTPRRYTQPRPQPAEE